MLTVTLKWATFLLFKNIFKGCTLKQNLFLSDPPSLPLDTPVPGSKLGPGLCEYCTNKIIKLGPGWLLVKKAKNEEKHTKKK